MRVPAIIYADEGLIRDIDDKVYEQTANVATLPGIVKAAYVMPDAHWGYGFPIGGVAAFDADAQHGLLHALTLPSRTSRCIVTSWSLICCAACAGVMIGLYYGTINFTLGYLGGIKAFTAAVLGGIGNVPGAMVGGFLLGIIEALGAGYFSAEYKDVYAFFILIAVLVFKPTGLLGQPIFAAAMGGVISMTRAIAFEYAAAGVTATFAPPTTAGPTTADMRSTTTSWWRIAMPCFVAMPSTTPKTVRFCTRR